MLKKFRVIGFGRLRVLIVSATLLALATPALADFQEGVDAFKRGNYSDARLQFEPLAQGGMAAAQANLGLMYSKGYGVTQDQDEAVRWYRRAADQGQAAAQNNLAAMYLNGDGVDKDLVFGFMWLTLAAQGGHAAAVKSVKDTELQMTSQQIDVARRLAALWKEKMALVAK